MTKFYLCCKWCKKIAAYPLYEKMEHHGEIWNNYKNKEFLEDHAINCGSQAIFFCDEEELWDKAMDGYKRQESDRKYEAIK